MEKFIGPLSDVYHNGRDWGNREYWNISVSAATGAERMEYVLGMARILKFMASDITLLPTEIYRVVIFVHRFNLYS